ncbi:MAG: enoyl-CoA hydratase/isomerase family protein [Hyphomicrobiaceae bacterium]
MTGKPVDEPVADEISVTKDIAITRRGAVATIVLKRVSALNALTIDMRAKIIEAIPQLARDINLYAVVMRSDSPKAFSAGGDVRELITLYKADPEAACQAFADEYQMNWTLECFSKPTVSLVDGVIMGSGVGLSIYNTHRVAGERYRFAMPETAIGLFPDVGVAHALSRLPGEIGTYLGLTGRLIGRADAFQLGLVTHCIAADRFNEIEEGLADARPIDPLLDGMHQDPGGGELAPHLALIAECFSGKTVEEIAGRLSKAKGESQTFAEGVLADLAKKSPIALKITLRHLRQASAMDLREVLKIDQRLACRSLEGDDFAEGVRAVLVDKDNLPVWKPPTLEAVLEPALDAYFAPLPKGRELELATREQMQASRI